MYLEMSGTGCTFEMNVCRYVTSIVNYYELKKEAWIYDKYYDFDPLKSGSKPRGCVTLFVLSSILGIE